MRLVQYISRYLDIYTPLTLERKLGSAVLMWHNTVSQGARGLLGNLTVDTAVTCSTNKSTLLLLLCSLDICISRSVPRVITSFATVR